MIWEPPLSVIKIIAELFFNSWKLYIFPFLPEFLTPSYSSKNFVPIIYIFALEMALLVILFPFCKNILMFLWSWSSKYCLKIYSCLCYHDSIRIQWIKALQVYYNIWKVIVKHQNKIIIRDNSLFYFSGYIHG